MTVAATGLLTFSLKYAVKSSMVAPMTTEGMDNKLVSVVLKPRLRRERVR
jgi:hypothetical protein